MASRVMTWSYDWAYEVFGDSPVADRLAEEIVPVQIWRVGQPAAYDFAGHVVSDAASGFLNRDGCDSLP